MKKEKLEAKVEVNVKNKIYEQNRTVLRLLLRSRMDFQALRKSVDNRIGRKADGSGQDIPERSIGPMDVEMFIEVSDAARQQEKFTEKNLEKVLKRFPVYEWLERQKGVGPVASAWLLGEFDIYKADTVSKMWQFAGLNPGMVRGKKSVVKRDYKPEMGKIAGELSNTKDGEKRVCVLTDEPVRGDRKTPGFLCPYNERLRTALVGVLADGFIKSQTPCALDHYYPYKERLENSDSLTRERKKKGEVELEWKDATKGHRHRAAIRKMIKEFLKDFYTAWRTLEGLPVREPYAVEYLGKRHGDFASGHEKTKGYERAIKLEKTMAKERAVRKERKVA